MQKFPALLCEAGGLGSYAGMEEELRIQHLQVADATRASLGDSLLEYVVADKPWRFRMEINIKLVPSPVNRDLMNE
ncbi:Protein of unknown function DUF3326 [Dillenia turbinata]|uniref:Uncharacterized protein n=1 Tax=Dillenia turbinata TaxID=194707 RepID=A0AAN8Z6E2_9MAGN